MIDRKAVRISILLVLAMIGANIWRLSLLPDWHHVPTEGTGDSRMIPVVWTFGPPLMVLFVMGVLYLRNWLRSGPEESVQRWRLYNGMALLFSATAAALTHAFNIARSLGALQSVDRRTVAHVIMVAAGVFMMAAGNNLPKMPWLTARFRPLDPWQWNLHHRFIGKLMVALGLFFAVGMPLVPVGMLIPVMIGLTLMLMVAGFWHRAKVRRDSSAG